MSTKIKSIKGLFELAGGSVHIAALLNLNQYTVDRWQRTGIPQKYWDTLTKKYGQTAETFHNLTKKARG